MVNPTFLEAGGFFNGSTVAVDPEVKLVVCFKG